jgi:hypothetical protein
MMDDPEVTIEPADNGYIVKHYQRSTKKDEGGRTIRRVASTAEEALGHAGKVLSTRAGKKKSSRDGQAQEAGAEASSPAAHSFGGHSRGSAKRRRPRVGGRRA